MLLKSTFLISIKRYSPTMISAGAVAAEVIIEATGEKNAAAKKHRETVTEVNPVLAPDVIPAADSAYTVTVDEPHNEPMIVADASAISTLCASGILPFLSSMPAREPVPIMKPKVSNISTIVIDKISVIRVITAETVMFSGNSEKSICINTFDMESGKLMI